MSETNQTTNEPKEDEIRDSVHELLGGDVLMQSVLGKLYAILTTGDEAAPASEDNFFAWVTPGYPVDPKKFEFAALGLSGEQIDKEELKKRILEKIEELKANREASGQENIEAFDTQALIKETTEEMQKDAFRIRNNGAYDFAQMVDFIPDVSGGSQANMKTQYDEGTLSDVYSLALKSCQVKRVELTPEQQQKVDKYRDLLNDKIEETTDILGEKTTKITRSPLMQAYEKYEGQYEQAVVDFHNKLIDGMYGDLKARQDWNLNGNTYRNKVRTAEKNWEVAGYKSQVDKMASELASIESHNFSIMRSEFLDLLKEYELKNEIASYLYTTFTPSDFASSNGWTKFTFDHDDMTTYATSNVKTHSCTVKTSSGSFFHKHSTSNTNVSNSASNQSKFNSTHFKLSFEFCQVRIVRPWFKTSFLTSKYWRFDPAISEAGQCLCDGGNPPSGMMPAYPTSMLIIRNLTMEFENEAAASDFESSFKSSSASYGGGVSVGIFGIKAGASYSSSDSKSHSEYDASYSRSGQSITVPGMQVIGFNCHVIGKAPDPNTELSDEEWT